MSPGEPYLMFCNLRFLHTFSTMKTCEQQIIIIILDDPHVPAQSPLTLKGEGWVGNFSRGLRFSQLAESIQHRTRIEALTVATFLRELCQDCLLLPNSENQNKCKLFRTNCWLISKALEEAFRVGLQLSESEQFINVTQQLCSHTQTSPC